MLREPNVVEAMTRDIKPTAPPSPPLTLRGEIKKGVDWVVFVWQMLSRLGGPKEILRTLWLIVTMLVQRALRR